jgi:SPP1 gp7 family putative phage head morphogenesis protein
MADLTIKVPGTFDEAVKWAEARGVVLSEEFYNVLKEGARGRSFTVTGLAGLDQIQKTLDSLNESLKTGETFSDWKKRFGHELDLPDARLETIFRNHMQNAYNAGRWRQFEDNKNNRPYLMFSAINDSRTTPFCRAHNGIIRKVDDEFWNRASPPAHHRCRSTLLSLSESQAIKRSPANDGINKPNPSEPISDGWGYKPNGDDAAAGLVTSLSEKVKDLPMAWLTSLLKFFNGGWSALITWIRKIF